MTRMHPQLLDIHPKLEDFLSKSLSTDPTGFLLLAGDASARRYVRIFQGEKSYVTMIWEPFDGHQSFPFLSVHQHFKKHGVQVPEVLAMSAKDGLILLEDLGDLTLERKFWESQDQSMSLPLYEQALEELLKIHFPCSHDKLSPCTAFHISFDVEKLMWEMNYAKKHLLEGLGKVQWGSRNAEIDKVFLKICEALDVSKKWICHRDYHSRNLMLKQGNMRVIDFQDARMGPLQYDLVSLLYDSYVQLNSNMKEHLLSFYCERAREMESQFPVQEEFDEIFRIQVIQRCFKACGSFASFYNMRKDTRYLKYISSTLQTVSQHLELFPEYSSFYKLLNDEGLLNQNFENL